MCSHVFACFYELANAGTAGQANRDAGTGWCVGGVREEARAVCSVDQLSSTASNDCPR